MQIADKIKIIKTKEFIGAELTEDEKMIKLMEDVLYNIEIDMLTFSKEYRTDKLFRSIKKDLEPLSENIE